MPKPSKLKVAIREIEKKLILSKQEESTIMTKIATQEARNEALLEVIGILGGLDKGKSETGR